MADTSKLTDVQRKLVEDNIGLVYHQVHKHGVKDEDLIQEGMLALINAAKYFSPKFGVKFSTYASSYIWAGLQGSYYDKKNKKKAVLTDSLDDSDLNIQPLSDEDECFSLLLLTTNCDPLANDVIKHICNGFTKKQVSELLGITSSRLNAILKKVGRDLYAERFVEKENK